MRFFSFFSARIPRRLADQRMRAAVRKLQAAPFAPRRLEKRRVLDAAAAELLLGSLGPLGDVSGDYVQASGVQASSVADEGLSTTESAATAGTTMAPSHVELFLSAESIFENEVLHIAATFDALDVTDIHTATIDWGDGTTPEVIVLDPGTRFLGTSHQYLDDNPTATPTDVNAVRVTIANEAGYSATATASLTVKNVAPTINAMTITRMVDEHDVARLHVAFSDPGTQDTHTVEIDWGDGSAIETVVLDPGARFLGRSHQYSDDNPSATSSDINTVQVKVIDDDGGVAMDNRDIVVKNIAPVLNVATDQTVDEGALLDLTSGGLGSFTDVGTLDTHTATVNWGDGTPIELVAVNQGAGFGTLDASHRYADNGLYTVTVRVYDDDGGVDVETFGVAVSNVAPTLTVVGDQTAEEGTLLEITNLGTFVDPGFDNPLNTLDPSNGGQVQERFFYQIDWGDGSGINLGLAPIDVLGGADVLTQGSFDGSHIYADDGLYTVSVQLIDDDGGVALQTFRVTVSNVDPVLIDFEPTPTVDEGSAFTLNGLGVSVTDLGFDNPFSPLEPGGSEETLTALSIDWGDGTPLGAIDIVGRVSGGPGVPTVAEFEHAPHTYADNGLYTVTIRIADDDGGVVSRSFQIEAQNVAPDLVLTERELEINEGETLDLFDLGRLSDPGFDNPLNVHDATNGGQVTETFSYTIDWGDGTIETGQLPATVVSGSAGVETFGTLVDSHEYLDNDADNLYTITVTVSDDDGGVSAAKSILVRVLNVNPELDPIVATDLNTRGETVLTLEFADPGTEALTVWVDWGDRLDLLPEDRFVPERFVLGPGDQFVTLEHTYSGPPDPLSPASDIIISAFIRDDDFGIEDVVDLGQSETQLVAISNPGEGVNPVVIDTSPQVPRLIFPRTEDSTFFVESAAGDGGVSQTTDLRTAVGDTKSTTDRFLELRVIDPATGKEGEGHRLKSEVLNDLPGLFRTLPDNHYAIYLVRTETNTRRLVIEVYVRNGKLIDPGDDSEGTRDRPPTDEKFDSAAEQPQQEVAPTEEIPAPQPDSDGVSATNPYLNPGSSAVAAGDKHQNEISQPLLLGGTLVGVAASRIARPWPERIDQALASADARQWQRLRLGLRRRPPNNPN